MPRSTAAPTAPRVTPPDLPATLAEAAPRRNDDLHAAELRLAGHADLAHSALEQCRIVADAESADFSGATLLDVEMTAPRIASLVMRDVTVRRLLINGGRIGTLDLTTARISELELRDVRVDYLTLGGARGEDILLTGCTIHTLDLPQAQLTRVRFDGCRSQEVDPRGLRATHVDLRGLDADAFLDVNSLRGTTLSPFQVQLLAPVMAAGLGIRIYD